MHLTTLHPTPPSFLVPGYTVAETEVPTFWCLDLYVTLASSTLWGPIHPWHSARSYGMAGSKTRSLTSGKGIGGGGEGEVGTFSTEEQSGFWKASWKRSHTSWASRTNRSWEAGAWHEDGGGARHFRWRIYGCKSPRGNCLEAKHASFSPGPLHPIPETVGM